MPLAASADRCAPGPLMTDPRPPGEPWSALFTDALGGIWNALGGIKKWRLMSDECQANELMRTRASPCAFLGRCVRSRASIPESRPTSRRSAPTSAGFGLPCASRSGTSKPWHGSISRPSLGSSVVSCRGCRCTSSRGCVQRSRVALVRFEDGHGGPDDRHVETTGIGRDPGSGGAPSSDDAAKGIRYSAKGIEMAGGLCAGGLCAGGLCAGVLAPVSAPGCLRRAAIGGRVALQSTSKRPGRPPACQKTTGPVRRPSRTRAIRPARALAV